MLSLATMDVLRKWMDRAQNWGQVLPSVVLVKQLSESTRSALKFCNM